MAKSVIAETSYDTFVIIGSRKSSLFIYHQAISRTYDW